MAVSTEWAIPFGRLDSNGTRKKEYMTNVGYGYVLIWVNCGMLSTAAGSGSESRLEVSECAYTKLQAQAYVYSFNIHS